MKLAGKIEVDTMIKKNCKTCKYLIKEENGFFYCQKTSGVFTSISPCYYYTPKGLSEKEEELYRLLRTIGVPVVIVSLPKELIGALGKLKKLDIVEEGFIKIREIIENKVGVVTFRTKNLKTVCLKKEFL